MSVLEINKIYKSFGSKIIFEDFSCSFENGISGISAPSGHGKTTLIRMIAGLDSPDRGEITGAGTVSVDFQEPRLFPWLSAEKNASVAESTQGLGAEILGELGLGSEKKTPPRKLSGGMQKRVSLARALAADFDTLLLDEPFTGLDEQSAEAAFEAVARRSRGKRVIIATHDAALLSRLDKVLILPPVT